MKYKGREFHKDVPNDQEKLMTRIINSMNSYAKKKDQTNEKKAANTLVVMSNDEEELVYNEIDDDNNCEAVDKQTNKQH